MGTLRHWWDQFPKVSKQMIQALVRYNDDGYPTVDTANNEVPNPVESLLATIQNHFCSPVEDTQRKHKVALLGLQIRKLDDYDWYKKTFLKRVFQVGDSQKAFWKENFSLGYPMAWETWFMSNLRMLAVLPMATCSLK